MSRMLILFEDQNLIGEIRPVLSNLEGWEFFFSDGSRAPFSYVEKYLNSQAIYFVLCMKPLSDKTIQELGLIHSLFPLIQLIYYHPTLRNTQFSQLQNSGADTCIIGEDRRDFLQETLNKEWQNHWKRIPWYLYNINDADLPPRARRVIRFIENNPLSFCNTRSISAYLQISDSHFRAEFRADFSMNFREFKQRVMTHYESILLLEKKMRPGEIISIMDYKNISNFSRSFKSRHGMTYQALLRNYKNVIETEQA